MGLLKKPGSDKGRLIGLAAVDSIILLLEHGPFLIGKLQRRRVDVIPPVFDILYDDLVRGMYRESAGCSGREGVCDAPCVYYIHLPH